MQYIQKWCSWLKSEFMKSRYPWTYFSYVEVPLVCYPPPLFFAVCIVCFLNAMNKLQGWKDTSESYKDEYQLAALVENRILKTWRYSVNALCNLWFCCSVLFMQHLFSALNRDPSSVTLPEVSSILYFPDNYFFSQVFRHSYRGSKDRGCRSLYSL